MAFAVHRDSCLCAVRRGGGIVGVDAFENGLHAAYEQFHLDRFGEVVVGSDAEAGELLLLFAQCREEDDHRVAQPGVAADGAAGLHAVHHGHHHIQQNQVRTAGGGPLQRFGAVLGRIDLVPFADEVVTDEFEDVHLVVHQQDAMAHVSVFRWGRPSDGGPDYLSAKIANFPLKPSAYREK